MAAEKPSSKGQAWFCTTGLPSDIEIEVDDMTFHLHKFPLMSKSRKLHHLITDQETKAFSTKKPQTTAAASSSPTTEQPPHQKSHEIEEEEEEEEEEEQEVEEEDGYPHITLQNFPGGSEIFEMVARFCYGVKMDLSAVNAAQLRCAGEYLEMTEEYSPENLISKTERFLSQSVFKSLRESVKALKSCESVSSLTESLGITDRCIDSIVSKASSADPSLFGWPVSDGAGDDPPPLPGGALNQTDVRRKKPTRDSEMESWSEDLSQLSLPLFNRLILAMRSGDLSPGIVESCLICYAKKHIPGISRSNRKPPSSSSLASENEQRDLLEIITSNLPLEKSSTSATMRFLFGLLRTAIILNASEACRAALERKIGLQLEQATLDDLLIPSYSYLNETLYDVDLVGRILGYFLDGLEDIDTAGRETVEEGGGGRSPALMLAGKLIDGYLAEIASDANLKPGRFYSLAISLPDQARLYDDGLYRAIDVYLKAHSWITEADREKICGVMDCQKLTLEACTHAAQNERLPLRAVVQVLFFEQLQLRQAIAGTLLAASAAQSPSPSHLTEPRPSATRRNLTATAEVTTEVEDGAGISGGGGHVEANKWRETVRENQVLRLDMDTMRTRVHQLERECSSMKKVISKIDKESGPTTGWSFTKKFGCKFKTQVCDSHESTVVDGRKKHQR